MNALEVAQQYFDGWNSRDPQAVLATLADGGTYQDPATGGPLSGEALVAYMNGLFAGFPDVSFEIVSAGLAADDLVAAQWIMRGTNTGPFMDLPPSGKPIEVTGADFIRVAGDKIQSVTGYFDSRGIPDQIGLQVVVQPKTVGPFEFGTSTRVASGNNATPGAFSVTCLQVRSPEEAKVVSDQARMVATELLQMKGFVGLVTAQIGDRMMTISAWETTEDPKQLMRGGQHGEAMKLFFGPEVALGGHTGVWSPARLNARLVRCRGCGNMADRERGDTCACGAKLGDAIAYW